MNNNTPQARLLPHQRLVAYQHALTLLKLVHAAEIRSARIRDQVLRAAQSVCLNIGEAAGRTSAGDRLASTASRVAKFSKSLSQWRSPSRAVRLAQQSTSKCRGSPMSCTQCSPS